MSFYTPPRPYGSGIYGAGRYGSWSLVLPGGLTTGQGGDVAVSLWRVTEAGALLEDVTDVLMGGRIRWTGDRDNAAQMTCELTVTDAGRFRPLIDTVMPRYTLTHDDGTIEDEPLGLFDLDVPAGEHDPAFSAMTLTGQDLLGRVANSVLEDTFNVAPGDNFGERIETLLTDAGITNMDIRATDRTAGKPRSYWRNSSRLDVINDLLASIGWYPLFMERSGLIRSLPFRDLALVQPSQTLTLADITTATIRQTPHPETLANVVTVTVDRMDQAPITAYAEETRVSIPISTTNLGRRLVKSITDVDFETTADAHAYATQVLRDSAKYYETVELETLPHPGQGIYRTVDLIDVIAGTTDLSGRYELVGWEIDLDPTHAGVTLTLSRLVPFTTEAAA